MFERFTVAAREAVISAQSVATRSGSRRIDSRHLLIALLDAAEIRSAFKKVEADASEILAAAGQAVSKDGLDAEALSTIGIDLVEVNRRTEKVFGLGALKVPSPYGRHLPFSPDAKKVLELALREAIRLQQRGISERHLLLGILRADCPGRRLLDSRLDVTNLRAALESPAEQVA